ncbi:MAG: hypothetical protein N2688_05990, partial [Burkholderiaceae bacterium]|nr:hypothetical protein [Burkholderiaceae bacterium]
LRDEAPWNTGQIRLKGTTFHHFFALVPTVAPKAGASQAGHRLFSCEIKDLRPICSANRPSKGTQNQAFAKGLESDT